jgi:hypothetical protein
VWVDDTDGRSVHPALRDAVSAVDAGHPVPVMLGPSPHQMVQAEEFHYLLMVGHHNGVISVYDPLVGAVGEVPESHFYNGRLDDMGPHAAHVNSVSLPGGS